METRPIDFFLAPDGPSARRVRKHIADTAPGLYRIVGTWPELLAQAEACYLLTPISDQWSVNLKKAASDLKDAFWSASLEVAPRETIAELDMALLRLLEAAGPDPNWKTLLEKVPLDSRTGRRLSDLYQLAGSVIGLPAPLQRIDNLLAITEPPLQAIRVYFSTGTIDLNPWQSLLLNKLENDASPLEPDLQELVNNALTPPHIKNPALQAARNMFGNKAEPAPAAVDDLRVIAVRDSLSEAEIAAGLIQSAMKNGNRLADMGLLLPDDPLSVMVVQNVFQQCGLPLSGLQRPVGQRDLGRETIRAFLLCLRKPAPIMAIAALLTSPLMPWSADEGQIMAQAVMDGDVLLRKAQIPAIAEKLMTILNDGATLPDDLKKALEKIGSLLSAGNEFNDHVHIAKETIHQLQDVLAGLVDIEWEKLLDIVSPESLYVLSPTDYWQDGIAVFHEGTLPWCAVKHLFVLGFNEGHFPAGAGSSAVFTEAEWEQIEEAGWPVLTSDLIRKRQRRLFTDQIAAATESLTLFFTRRDALGQVLAPSSSLVFLSRSLGVDADALTLDLDRSEDIRKISDLPLAKKALPSPPRRLSVADIELGVDLLETVSRKPGTMAPLSPSAADTLMVSPFAWLLDRLGCKPRSWVTDEFDMLTAGSLAHLVFEELFQSGEPLPSEADIEQKVPKILRERVLQIAPFLRSPDWRVERYKFESEILRAALKWKALLDSCNAAVLGAEQWLHGNHGEIPLHGQSDLLVGLPSGKLLVVDYKKSSSGKRRERMRRGFDLQAHLYRLMIQTGGLEGFETPPEDIGIVYYLMNDTRALADSPVDTDGSVPGWEILDNDISLQAMQHLDRRLTQIRSGTVALNTAGDEKWWEDNAGLRIYALDNSPLLRLFMHPETGEGAP